MRAPSEAGFTRTVLDYALHRGWLRAHFRAARTLKGWRTPVQGDGKGFPDLILLRGPRLVVPELKMPGNTTTPEQDRWLAAFREAGAEVFVWTPENWKEIEDVLR